MARAMNVVALLVAVGFAGCMGESSDAVAEAMNIASEVNAQVQGAQTLLKEPTDTDDDETDPEVAYAYNRRSEKDTYPTQADTSMVEQVPKVPKDQKDPEVAYAEKHETQADAAMVEQVPKVTAEAATQKATVAADAANAHIAAKTAKQAAKVANKVAKHSVQITAHAKDALKNAHNALHAARVNTAGLSNDQKSSLKKAEKKLHDATKDAEYGQIKDAKYTKAKVENKVLQKLEKKMDVVKKEKKVVTNAANVVDNTDELAAMQKSLDELRKQLKAQGLNADAADDEAIKDLKQQIADMQKAEKLEDKADGKSHDEMKAEVERLRDMIAQMKASNEQKDAAAAKAAKAADAAAAAAAAAAASDKASAADKAAASAAAAAAEAAAAAAAAAAEGDAVPAVVHRVPRKITGGDAAAADALAADAADVRMGPAIDVDTAMPYGELEPFGREDTAQELTENSIKESNQMVDQLEKAEVSEEKRAVFRALTRLRGAAITSYDGVARSQTGNIDEYNKMHQWRSSHPLHHLADEESDVTKWAFPENAD